MPRIRNIKPEFFRHESLQKDGPIAMLVFAGLWTQCDKEGNFRWDAAQLKLDILPFIDFDMGSTLEALGKSVKIIEYFGSDGKRYGNIPTFKEHQRISGKEVSASPRFPLYLQGMEATGKHPGSNREAKGILDLGLRSSDLGVSPPIPPPGGVSEKSSTGFGEEPSAEEREENPERENRRNGHRPVAGIPAEFEAARLAWPGSKRGPKTEWEDFARKHRKEISEIVPLLLPAIEVAKKHRSWCEKNKVDFIPQWKNFKTWLHQRCWEEELPQEVYIR
jgi:hypothetical protein